MCACVHAERKLARPPLIFTRCAQELGPRFTLKLESIQKGTFNATGGEFEWLHTKKMDTSRRKFHL